MNSTDEIRSKIKLIICGITSTDNPSAFTGCGREHFMDNWDWFQGVALFGIYQYACEFGEESLFSYLAEWFDCHISRGLPEENVNSMCPMLTLACLYEHTGKKDYLNLCMEWAEYAMNKLPRTEEGGFQHITMDRKNHGQLWDDTLYMTVLFLAKMGALLKNEAYIDESVRQFLLHIKYLHDSQTGLFFHGFSFVGRHHFAKARWGRGNAWYTAGLVDYLELAHISEGVRAFLIGTLETQARALKNLQRPDGMWNTLLNDSDSYPEASATAGFAYGLLKSVRKGYLPKEYALCAESALSAVCCRIDENGLLKDVSAGTCLSDSLDYYRNIPRNAQPYGQSMALLALMEGLRLAQRREEENKA